MEFLIQAVKQSHLRLDIQGLRALAVVLVVAFHLSPKTIPGGYIGVDIFFVISGYLITAHLMREVVHTGSVKLLEFWARRVRRLLPAAFLVLAVSAVAVYILLPATVRGQNFIEIAFAAAYVLNWRLAYDSVDYLAADNVASVAQHYWTLSVEEQFYFVWPILILIGIWCAAKMKLASRRQVITALLVIVFVASLAFSIYETTRSQPSAYFLTTTRAWEFAAGGLVALVPIAKLRGFSHAALSWLGIGLIGFSAFMLDGHSPFPGWIALFPVAGVAVLLWVKDSDLPWSPQYLLKFGPAQLIGDTSYAIYLWHWPLIVVATSLLGRSPGWIWGGVIVAVTLALAVATKYLVEDPVRRAPGILKLRMTTFGLMAGGMAAIIAFTLIPVQIEHTKAENDIAAVANELKNNTECFGANAVLNNCEDPYSVTSTVIPTASKADGPGPYIAEFDSCESLVSANRAEYDCDSGGGTEPSIMVVGDSQMYSMFPAFGEASKKNNWHLQMRARASCPGFGVTVASAPQEEKDRCAAWSNEVREDIFADKDLDAVLFVFRQHKYPDMSVESAQLFSEIKASGKQVIALIEVPGAGPNVHGPDCVAASTETESPCAWTVTQRDTWLNSVAQSTGAELMNPWDILCHDGTCETVIGGTLVYRDTNHFAATFAKTLAPWVQLKLDEFVTAESQ